MSFPDERDRKLARRAADVYARANRFTSWLGEFSARRQGGPHAISQDEQLTLLQLRRRARGLYSSASSPVAAAVYGPSQVGKSLFIGRVLSPIPGEATALGRDEPSGAADDQGESRVSFDRDLNPRSGAFEATALVTRFTVAERMSAAGADADHPVLVRPLSRAEWLCVLAKGFQVECAEREEPWTAPSVERLLERLAAEHPPQNPEPSWRSDLLDAYAYARDSNSRVFRAAEHEINGLLGRYPMSHEGYCLAAAELFWGGWRGLTELFRDVCGFLSRLQPRDDGQGPLLFTEWRAVRFLLDSQRNESYETPNLKQVSWSEFRLHRTADGKTLLDRASSDGPAEKLEIVQSAMLELVIPVLPEKLHEDWRKVFKKMDLLDVPGIKPGKVGDEKGKRENADLREDQLEIVKRGKVAFLFERYTAERQIQTLLLLVRAQNLNVGGFLKGHLKRWGESRYEQAWHLEIPDHPPSLFLGLTGFDDAIRSNEGKVLPEFFNHWLREINGALSPILDNYGGQQRKFRNTFVVRYPGSWDCDEATRVQEGPQKWRTALESFLASKSIQDYVDKPEEKISAALRDGDGGVSLIAAGFLHSADPVAKQDELQKRLEDVESNLDRLSRSWYVPVDINSTRKERQELASKTLAWLRQDERQVYHRVNALRESLSVKEGDAIKLADLRDMPIAPDALGVDPVKAYLPDILRSFLRYWAVEGAPAQWRRHMAAQERMLDARTFASRFAPQAFSSADFARLTSYLGDYLNSDGAYESLHRRLEGIVDLRLNNPAALKHARRTYVRLVLNDFVFNPGPENTASEEATVEDSGRFGLMTSFVDRWSARLPEVLAAGAGQEVTAPPGNDELLQLLKA